MKQLLLIASIVGFFLFFTGLSNHTIFANIQGNFSLKNSSNQKQIKPLPRSSKIKPQSAYLDTKEGLNPDEISAQSALIYEKDTDKIIFAKNINDPRPIASLTKLATFLVAVENKPLDALMTVTDRAASQEPDSMGLFPNERLTLKQLLAGMILVSGNDSAETIAENIFDSSRETFINKMNEKAYFLGMDGTNFVNPTGFDEDHGDGHSTVFDLLLITLEALQNPVFVEIAGQHEQYIPEVFNTDENHKAFYLTNTSPTIDYPGYKAGKPGFTPNSGKCQITVIESNGKELIAIILGSNDRKTDTEKMFSWATSL